MTTSGLNYLDQELPGGWFLECGDVLACSGCMHACKEEQGVRWIDGGGKLADREKIIPNDDPVSHKARAGGRASEPGPARTPVVA